MRYALLAYQNADVLDRRGEEAATTDQRRRSRCARAAECDELATTPTFESATTVRQEHGKTLLTDGPFVDSKDYLGGFILVEAENLDGALAVARELQELTSGSAIEVRPVREEPLVGA